MPYKNIVVFSLFQKNYREKRNKNSIFVYPGLRYADKKIKLACKMVFLKKIV